VSSLPWVIGNGSVDQVDGFVGAIDEVAIYDRALTEARVRAHRGLADDPAAYREAVMADGPIGYWRLDEPAGTLARDETGQWDGTYVGDLAQGQPGAVSP
jgi:hypothetical protein